MEITLLISIAAGDSGGVCFPAQRARDPHPERRGAGVAHRHVRRDVSARLQPGQPVADGAHHRHGICRRRCHRRDRKHLRAIWKKAYRQFAAALRGAKEIGFTVVSISLSLVAVFIPILLMGGIVGRLFREFAVTLSVAIRRFAGGLADRRPR